MKSYLKHTLAFILVFFIYTTEAQNNVQKNEAQSVKTQTNNLNLEKTNPNSNPIPNPPTIGEPIPTPEQQGYTKYVVEGKDFYYKEEGQLQILYKPN